MRQTIAAFFNRLQGTFLAFAALLFLSLPARAELPAPAAAAFTTVSGYVTDIVAAIWPILAAVTAAFALMKLFKKGVSKAV